MTSTSAGSGGARPASPKQKYKVTFLPDDVAVVVDPGAMPYSDHGLPGSVLDIALGHGVTIPHACGGFNVCSTCHVIIKQGHDACSEPDDTELDSLELAYGFTPQSRLACQCVPNGSCDIVVEVPAWNRNVELPDLPPPAESG